MLGGENTAHNNAKRGKFHMVRQDILRQLESSSVTERQAGIKALAKSRNIQSLPLLMALIRVEADPETRHLAIKAGRYIRHQNQTQKLFYAQVPLLTYTPVPRVHLDTAPVTALPEAPRREAKRKAPMPTADNTDSDTVDAKNDDWVYEESTAASLYDLPEVPERPTNAPTG